MLLPEDVKIYLRLEPTDMRKSIDTLCTLVKENLSLELGSGHLFLFCSPARNKLKALYYEQNSFTLWYRRLERSKCSSPLSLIPLPHSIFLSSLLRRLLKKLSLYLYHCMLPSLIIAFS